MKLLQKKILVTGAGGFIGSHLVEKLLRGENKVRAFVHYNSFNRWGWLDYIEKDIRDSMDVFIGDIRDPYGVKKAVEGCDIIFHLAALIGIPYSYYSPESYVDTNIKGTLNVLQAVKELGIERVIHTSTSEVYGTAQFIPISEKHPINPQSPYSAAKAGADHLALSFNRSFDLPIAIIRPFNTYGPRQSARAIIPSIIIQILNRKKKIMLGSLHPTRDLTYVNDTIGGFIKVAESDISVGKIVNIGNNSEISIKDLVTLLLKLTNAKIEIVLDNKRIRPRESEVMRLCADTGEAKKIGWYPRYTIEDGLEKTIEWFSNANNLKFYKPNIYNV